MVCSSLETPSFSLFESLFPVDLLRILLVDFFLSYLTGTFYFSFTSLTSLIYLNFWLLVDLVIDFIRSFGLVEVGIVAEFTSFLLFRIVFSFFSSVLFSSSDSSTILFNFERGEFSSCNSSPDRSIYSSSACFFTFFTFVSFTFGLARSKIICLISSLCRYSKAAFPSLFLIYSPIFVSSNLIIFYCLLALRKGCLHTRCNRVSPFSSLMYGVIFL